MANKIDVATSESAANISSLLEIVNSILVRLFSISKALPGKININHTNTSVVQDTTLVSSLRIALILFM